MDVKNEALYRQVKLAKAMIEMIYTCGKEVHESTYKTVCFECYETLKNIENLISRGDFDKCQKN